MIYIVKITNLSINKFNKIMIDLRSDTVTLPSKKMMENLMNSSFGDDVYQEDPCVNNLENEVAKLFGKEKALFVTSGTMANLVSVLTHCQRGDEILLGDKSHIFKYEVGGISSFGGIHSHQIKNNDNGTMDIENIRNNIRNETDIHFPKTKLLCLENTHNLCFGAPIKNDYTASVKNILDKNNIKLHIDGARIFNASIALKASLKELAKHADSLSCCLSKGLGAPAGSLIVANEKFIYQARKLRKALGGGMRQVGVLASCGHFAIDNMIERLQTDHNNAQNLANELSNIEEIDINLKKIHTNLIFFHLNTDKINDEDFLNQLLNYKIKIDYKGNRRFRMVTHCNFKEESISKIITTIKKILN